MTGWQPIETAPKDGNQILGWGYPHDDGGPYEADGTSFMGETPAALVLAWREHGWVDVRGGGSYDGPTHWVPIPEAPHCAPDNFMEPTSK